MLVNTSDITTQSGCEELISESIKLGAVGGIFNLAVHLSDGIFENQTVERFVECMASKAVATRHLDVVSRQLCPKLQHFVVFSSVSCGRGNAGQSNYGMANSVMERIIERRYNLGLPAKAIQWGAIGEVGLIADKQEDKIDMDIGGTLQQRIASCLEELDNLLKSESPLVASMVVAEKRYKSGAKGNILDSIMNIMSIRDVKSLSMETTFTELGMDSLMLVEIQQSLEREYDLIIAPQDLRSMTLSQLVKHANKNASSQSKTKILNQNVPTGIALLLRNYGDETNSEQTILKLKSLTERSKVKTLIVPGIEGVAGQAWYAIAEKLKSSVYVLQTRNSWNSCDLDCIFDSVIENVVGLFADISEFIIIGYSFGALLGMKLAKALETNGKVGRLVLIDGSPKFLKTLAHLNVPGQFTDEVAEQTVLAFALPSIFADDAGEKSTLILAEATWNGKLAKFRELTRKTSSYSKYSEEFTLMIMNALVNRLKLAANLDVKAFSTLNSTQITLVRPSEASVIEIEEDYDLCSYCEKKVEIKFIDGNHMTVLDSVHLTELINSYFD